MEFRKGNIEKILPNKSKSGKKFCRICGKNLKKTIQPGTIYCSWDCSVDFNLSWHYVKGTWSVIRKAILERDNYTCQKCKKEKDYDKLEVHHKIPRAEGGDDDFNNLITLCYDCHRGETKRFLHRYHSGIENQIKNHGQKRLSEFVNE